MKRLEMIVNLGEPMFINFYNSGSLANIQFLWKKEAVDSGDFLIWERIAQIERLAPGCGVGIWGFPKYLINWFENYEIYRSEKWVIYQLNFLDGNYCRMDPHTGAIVDVSFDSYSVEKIQKK
jgi:hypothetical protein